MQTTIEGKPKKRTKVIVEMSKTEYKKYLEYKESVRIAKILLKGVRQAELAEEGKIKLKSLEELLDEL
jgi:hypothetical protein